MKNEFVPYEQAVALKQLGFDKPCFAVYEDKKWFLVESKNSMSYELCLKTDTFPVPTFSQAFRFFREKYGYYADLFVDDDKTFGFMISSFVEEGVLEKPITRQINSHEEAELKCLAKLIEIVKNK
jgi:hypothetical protein